jgi:hypothetical protein
MDEKREIRHYNGCVKESDMFLIRRGQRKTVIIDSQLGPLKRNCYLLNVKKFDKEKSYLQKVYVDSVTGTMYDFMSGECLSSTRLSVIQVLK